jgi:hypothetical protein
MTDRTPIQLPPGVQRNGSEAEMAGRWYDVHLVRWIGNVLRPIAGWDRFVPTVPQTDPEVPAPEFHFVSPVRALHQWVTRDGIERFAVFCETRLYVVTLAGEVTEITPVDGIVSPEDAAIGGYGDLAYDSDTYGDERAATTEPFGTLGPMWTLDNFGDDLLAMASADGRLLRWDANTPGAVAKQAGDYTVPGTPVLSPTGRFFVVTPERHVMIFQDGDAFNRMRWCSQEDVSDWDETSLTNSAGMYEIEPAQPFLCGVSTRRGVLAFTTGGMYIFNYIGTPYFYSYQYLGEFAAPVAGTALAAVADLVVWYASDGFWQLTGGTTVEPLRCDVLDWIQATIDPINQYARMTAIYVGHQSEIWFCFPALGEAENSRIAIWNYEDKWWSMGRLARTCGIPGTAMTYPLMSDGVNIFRHEKGLFYYDAPELPYAQTGAINVADGGRSMTIRKGLVDTRAPAEDVVFMVAARKNRISDGTNKLDVQTNLAVRKDGGKLDFRVTGRDLVIRIQSARSGVEPWTFGKMLVAVAPRGGR